MRKLYFLTFASIVFCALSVQAQQNLLPGGTMETADADHWKISNLANDPSSITSYEFGYTNDIPTKGEGGSLHIMATNAKKAGSHIMFYQPVTVIGGKTYRYDFAVKAVQPLMNAWLEVYVGTTEPKDGEDYGTGQKPLGGFKSSNWAGQCTDIFDGTLQEDGCLEGSQDSFVVAGEGEQTLYIGFKAGIWEYDITIEFVVDNVSLVEVGTTNVATLTKNSNLKVYPNPANTNISIQSEISFDGVRILNVLGQEKMSIGQSNGQIDVSSLKSGVYIVELMKENKTVAQSRFIKQ